MPRPFEQTFSYSIAYEPVDHLTIAVPRELASARRIQVRIDGGEPISPVLSAKDLADGAAGTTVPVKIALPEPRIGACELTLSYSVPLGDFASSRPAAIAIPLAMPTDGEILSNFAAVATSRDIRVVPRKGAWTAFDRNAVDATYRESVETSEARHGKITLLRAGGRADSLDLDVRRDDSGPPESTIVDRAWIQSWLTPTARQDRAVFQFVTDRKELEVVLPAGVAADQTAAMVDGQLVEPRVTRRASVVDPAVRRRRNRRRNWPDSRLRNCPDCHPTKTGMSSSNAALSSSCVIILSAHGRRGRDAH